MKLIYMNLVLCFFGMHAMDTHESAKTCCSSLKNYLKVMRWYYTLPHITKSIALKTDTAVICTHDGKQWFFTENRWDEFCADRSSPDDFLRRLYLPQNKSIVKIHIKPKNKTSCWAYTPEHAWQASAFYNTPQVSDSDDDIR